MAGVAAEVSTDGNPMTLRERLERAERCIAVLENRILNLSQALAEKEHGRANVVAAFQRAELEPGLMDAFVQAPHPFDELMTWAKKETTQ